MQQCWYKKKIIHPACNLLGKVHLKLIFSPSALSAHTVLGKGLSRDALMLHAAMNVLEAEAVFIDCTTFRVESITLSYVVMD